MRHGILSALVAASLLAPALAAQAPSPDPQKTGDRRASLPQDPDRKALEENVRRHFAVAAEVAEREALRRQILARVDRKIAEAMDRLRAEIHAIVEEELDREEGVIDRHVSFTAYDRLPGPGAIEGLGPPQPWMGVELAAIEGRESLTVKRVLPVSPAATAGLREGDRILSVLGVPVADRSEMGAVLGTRLPGDRIEVKVQRGEEEVVLFLVLGARPEGHGGEGGMDEDDEEARLAAERAGSLGAAPAEDPAMVKIGFEDMEAGKPPKGWSFARTGDGPEGKWTVEKDGENSVLKQSSADETSARYPVAVLDGKEFGDFALTARFKALSGEVDQAGGVVFRYADANRYLICRANALEGNFRLYTVIDGKRTQLKSQNVKVTAREWHTIRVECRGKEIRCSYEGGEPLVAEVEGFAPGKVGFWTKADSVTLFDDLLVEPVGK